MNRRQRPYTRRLPFVIVETAIFRHYGFVDGRAMRIGILGGTFDPVHLGHLLMAESCREQVPLDRVIFVPAAMSPHKRDREAAPPTARVEMLQLAVAGHPQFAVSTLEVDRGGASYTIDTLEALQQSAGSDGWYLLMGADTLSDFPNWHRPADICRRAHLTVVNRPDAEVANLAVLRPFLESSTATLQPAVVSMPLIGISSSMIRQRVKEGRSIRYLVPRAVQSYIDSHRLYQD